MLREPVNQTAARWFNLQINDDIRIEWDVNNNPIYVGYAPRSTATSDYGWCIKKITFDVNNNPTYVQSVDNGGNYTWDGRAGYF